MSESSEKIKFNVGDDLGYSPWTTFNQSDIDVFASVTRDVTQLHNDPEWAVEKGPFDTTILLGFQTLSMLTYFLRQIVGPKHYKVALNYGLNRVRFLTPIPVNAEVRAHMIVRDIDTRTDGSKLTTFEVTVEIKGAEKPALKAEWLGLILTE